MIATNTGFDVGSSAPIDGRLVMTKAEMFSVNDVVMPDTYLCVCSEDKSIYVYSKENTIDSVTGKFRKQVNASGGVTADTFKDTTLGEEDFIAVFSPLA